MNKNKVIMCVILAVFITGMIVTPVCAKKYKNKNTITVKLIDGKKIVKVKCKYKKSWQQYVGHKHKYGKKYGVTVMYEKTKGLQGGKIGWWTDGTNNYLSPDGKGATKYNRYHPVTKLKLH